MGAELDGVAGKLGNVDHIGTADLILELGDARFKPALLFLCGMIFGVFGEIAMRARFFDRSDDTGALDHLQMFDLVHHCGVTRLSHWNLFHHCFKSVSSSFSGGPRRPPAW